MRRVRVRRVYTYTARELVDSITSLEQLRAVIFDILAQYADASPSTRRKIRRVLDAKEAELKGNPLHA